MRAPLHKFTVTATFRSYIPEKWADSFKQAVLDVAQEALPLSEDESVNVTFEEIPEATGAAALPPALPKPRRDEPVTYDFAGNELGADEHDWRL